MDFRTLTTVGEFTQVLALEQRIWGCTTADDAVPVMMLLVSSRIGGLVVGAHDEGRLVGFAYAMPGVRDGRPFQWSHMLGVDPAWREAGVGRRLKLEQRRLVMASGLDLIAWTFDPLQAANAHLNFAKLGTIAREYDEEAYPDSTSALHAGTPTDRLVAEWWLRSERVERRLEEAARGGAAGAEDRRRAVDAATPVNRVREGKRWLEPAGHDLSVEAAALAVTIPTGFTEMQQQDLPLATAWRLATREIFEALLSRGCVVDDFVLDRAALRGTYLLTRDSVARP